MTTPHGYATHPLTVAELYQSQGKAWGLELLAGEDGLSSVISTPELNRPGLAFGGFYKVFSSDRVQLVGLTETSYLESLTSETREEVVQRTLAFRIPCLIVTSSLAVCDELIHCCNTRNIPLLRTPQVTSPFSHALGSYLERRLAPTWTIHGVMLDVFGMGVLMRGKSGVGKSECALELIERGHRLVADDVVIVRRLNSNYLIAEANPQIGYHMEIRGIGIIDVELLYGVKAVREDAKINLIVTLEPWDVEKDYERLGISDRNISMFECQVPEYVLPVEPGRNISRLIEVAALTQRLEEQGVNVAEEFDRRIMNYIQKKTTSDRLFTAIDRLRPHVQNR